MTHQKMENTMNALGISKRVCSLSDKVVYVPAAKADLLRQNKSFKEVTDDTLYNALRHQNTGNAMIAFQY